MWHIGSFASFAFANILWTTIQAVNVSSTDIETRIGLILTLTSESLTVVCVAFSELPLLHIINSLVSSSLEDQAVSLSATVNTQLESQYDLSSPKSYQTPSIQN